MSWCPGSSRGCARQSGQCGQCGCHGAGCGSGRARHGVANSNPSTSGEIHAAFDRLARERPDALFVAPDPFFQTRRFQLAALAARHTLPAAYAVRQYVEAGGLMSYGTSLLDMHRQVGVYLGRILKGAKPADLPVVQSTKFELVIDAQIAGMLGLTVPPSLLATADEVIE